MLSVTETIFVRCTTLPLCAGEWRNKKKRTRFGTVWKKSLSKLSRAQKLVSFLDKIFFLQILILASESNQLLTKFVRYTYPDSATHWMVRKKFATQWALYAAAELATGLSSMNLKEIQLDLASAQLFSTGYSFDLTAGKNGDSKFRTVSKNTKSILVSLGDGPLFRLTPNLAEYMQVDIEEDGQVDLSGMYKPI